MSIHLNCNPTPTSQQTVQLAAFKNFANALQLEKPYVNGKQIEDMRYIFQQCAKDLPNAFESLKQLVSMVDLSKIELLPNGLLQRIFAHTLVYNFRAPLAAVSVKFRENIRDRNVMSLVLELPEWQSKTSLTLEEVQDFQQAVKKRCGVFYSLADMLKRLPNVQLDLTGAIINTQLFDQIIAAGPYLKSLDLSSSTITDKQLAQIAKTAPQLRSLDLTRCQNLRSPNLTGGTALIELCFVGCSQMQNPPVLTGLSALTELSFRDCSQMQNPPVLTDLTALTKLYFTNCRRMQILPVLSHLGALTELSFVGCSQMENPPVLAGLTALTKLHFVGCSQMQNPPILTGLSALTELCFYCSSMQNPPVLTGLTALTRLSFFGCSSMQNPPVLTGLRTLRLLNIRGCNIRPDTTGLSDELVVQY